MTGLMDRVARLEERMVDNDANTAALAAAQKRAFDALAVLGVSQERARSVSNGIEVLSTRYRKADIAQTTRIAELEAERDEWCAEARLLAGKLMERDAECIAERERREVAEEILRNIRDSLPVGMWPRASITNHLDRYKVQEHDNGEST